MVGTATTIITLTDTLKSKGAISPKGDIHPVTKRYIRQLMTPGRGRINLPSDEHLIGCPIPSGQL